MQFTWQHYKLFFGKSRRISLIRWVMLRKSSFNLHELSYLIELQAMELWAYFLHWSNVSIASWLLGRSSKMYLMRSEMECIELVYFWNGNKTQWNGDAINEFVYHLVRPLVEIKQFHFFQSTPYTLLSTISSFNRNGSFRSLLVLLMINIIDCYCYRYYNNLILKSNAREAHHLQTYWNQWFSS